MVVWEVCEEQPKANDAVVHKCTPWSPSPANLGVVVGPKLDVQQVWTEWKNKRSDQGERVATVLDRYDLSKPE